MEAELIINEELRRFNARLHSAGHLIDIAVKNLGLVKILIYYSNSQ